MKLLLDTHVLLWWLGDDPRLGPAAREAIASPDHLVYVSAASVWEIVIKQGAGRLELPADFPAVLAAEPLLPLPVTAAHAFAVAALPPLHQDPFDRLLVAQCQVEGMALVSGDERVKRYPVTVLEA